MPNIKIQSKDVAWTQPGHDHPAVAEIRQKDYDQIIYCWIGDVYNNELYAATSHMRSFLVEGTYDGKELIVSFVPSHGIPHLFTSNGWTNDRRGREYPLYIMVHEEDNA